jgi:hypothetical protein
MALTDYNNVNILHDEEEEEMLERIYDSKFTAYSITSDYLKYYRPVVYFASKKYKVTEKAVESLLFLYSERRFTYRRLLELEHSHDLAKKKMNELIDKGLLKLFLKRNKRINDVYCLTALGKNAVKLIYDLLEGNRVPPNTFANNPLLRKRAVNMSKMKLLEEISVWVNADRETQHKMIISKNIPKNDAPTSKPKENKKPCERSKFNRRTLNKKYKVKIVKPTDYFTLPQQYPEDEL